MFRLLVLLVAGLFLTFLIAGRDNGQTRFGLTGAYDVAGLKPKPEVVAVQPEIAAVDKSAVAPQPSETPVATPVSYSPEPKQTTAGLQSGLTLAVPLTNATPAADPEVLPVQTEAAAEEPLTQVGYVIGSKVNVRDAPSAKAAVVDRLARGEAVTVLGEAEPGWSIIRIEGDGVEGFIATRYLSVTPPDSVN